MNIEVTTLSYNKLSKFSRRRVPFLLLVGFTLGFALITCNNLHRLTRERNGDKTTRMATNNNKLRGAHLSSDTIIESITSDFDDQDFLSTATSMNTPIARPSLFEKQSQLSSSSIHPTVKVFKSALVTDLSNGLLFPLVGIGVGNIDHRKIPITVATHLDNMDSPSTSDREDQSQNKSNVGGIGLIDTVSSSIHVNNEALVARAILYFTKKRNKLMQRQQQNSSLKWNAPIDGKINLDDQSDSDSDINRVSTKDEQNRKEQNKMEVHIVTKVPHTHLGYGRTNLAVEESLKVLSTVFPPQSDTIPPLATDLSSGNVEVRVHVVLHSPRCDKGSSFPNCEKDEEKAVDAQIQQAGPSPHSDSWKDSWKALEEAYAERKINSIGVSNFNIQELNELFKFCKVKPHFYQGSIWSVLFDDDLMKLLNDNGVLFHAFNIMKGVIHRKDVAPHAFEMLTKMSEEIAHDDEEYNIDDDGKEEQGVHPASRLVLAWLVQRGIAVSPKSSSLDHLSENSPTSISSFPKLSPVHNFEVETAVRALLIGEDVHTNYYVSKKGGTIFNFVNTFGENVVLYRAGSNVYDKSDEVQLSTFIEAYKSVQFVAYSEDDVIIYDEKRSELGRETII